MLTFFKSFFTDEKRFVTTIRTAVAVFGAAVGAGFVPHVPPAAGAFISGLALGIPAGDKNPKEDSE